MIENLLLLCLNAEASELMINPTLSRAFILAATILDNLHALRAHSNSFNREFEASMIFLPQNEKKIGSNMRISGLLVFSGCWSNFK